MALDRTLSSDGQEESQMEHQRNNHDNTGATDTINGTIQEGDYNVLDWIPSALKSQLNAKELKEEVANRLMIGAEDIYNVLKFSSLSYFDDFQDRYAKKHADSHNEARQNNIPIHGLKEQEVANDIFTDFIIEKFGGNKSKALVNVVSNDKNEYKVHMLVRSLLYRGANPNEQNDEGLTVLYIAVERQFKWVCKTLLQHGACSNHGAADKLPLIKAMDNSDDAIAAILVTDMKNEQVRALFCSGNGTESQISYHKLLETEMQKTALAVLDCCIEKESNGQTAKVFYQVLEADEKGRPPSDPQFNSESKSPLYQMAKKREKALIFHDVVRLLIRRKWKKGAYSRFYVRFILYLVSIFALTYSVVVAVSSTNPMDYHGMIHTIRAFTDLFTCSLAFFYLVSELLKFKRQKIDYLHDPFNWLDLVSVLLLLSAIPFRVLGLKEQWPILSVAYLMWTLRIFKFALMFRKTGAYAQILWITLVRDFLPFMVFFLVILVAFSGAFVLSLKGEDSINMYSETSSFWRIMFLGLRIMIEAESLIDYTALSPMSCVIMLLFLFTCCVILLNILIAQLSDTYQNVQHDVWRRHELNFAWLVASGEVNSIFLRKDHRPTHYDKEETITDVRKELEKWDSPLSISDTNDISDLHKIHFWRLNTALNNQEETLHKIEFQLKQICRAEQATHF